MFARFDIDYRSGGGEDARCADETDAVVGSRHAASVSELAENVCFLSFGIEERRPIALVDCFPVL